MKLSAQTEVAIINMVTKEKAQFYITDLLERDGQYICYGETKLHGVRFARGNVLVHGRPGCFVVLPKETASNIAKLVSVLAGLPLAVVDGTDVLFILNMGRLPGFWDGQLYDKEKMIEHAAKMIDIYLEWKTLGRLPQWFIDLRNKGRRN